MMKKLWTCSCLLILSTLTNATFVTQDQLKGKLKCHFTAQVTSYSNNILIGSSLNFSQKEEQSYRNSFDDTILLHLPIFPLRKKVRFPTDKMNLNLYEPRYLALAERVLEQEQRIYGAIYCSQKPQMVSYGGLNPITPIVEPGDVGLLCEVYSSSTRPKTKEQKRRIQLSARGVGRFRIQKVLQKGYSFNDAQDMGEDNLPYIVVEACLLKDDKTLDQENEKIDDLIKKNKDEILTLTEGIDMIQFDELSRHIKTDNLKTEGTQLYSPKEIVTFALASKIIENKSAPEMLRLLTMTSTLQRLEHVLQQL